MEETVKSCWTCKHGLDEGQIWCIRDSPHSVIVENPNYGCERWEEIETSDARARRED